MDENSSSFKIIGAAINIHKLIGPGLLESAYEAMLEHDLREMGFNVKTQVAVPVIYKGVKLEAGYRADMVVEQKVLIEIKSIEALAPVHFAQTLTYLKLGELKLGLLINFNTAVLRDGIHRIVNNL